MKSSTKVKIARLWNYPSEIGDKYGLSWLTYNPGVFLEFALVARRNAPLFARAVMDVFPDVNSYNDIGCGTGQFVRQFQLAGKKASGYEYSCIGRFFARCIGVNAMGFDLGKEQPILKIERAGVAYSLEVGEHIPVHMSRKFVEVMTRAGDVVVFTAAQPGQKGHGHINCQPKEFWAKLFDEFGYKRSSCREAALLDKFSKAPRLSSFIKDNLQVFSPE